MCVVPQHLNRLLFRGSSFDLELQLRHLVHDVLRYLERLEKTLRALRIRIGELGQYHRAPCCLSPRATLRVHRTRPRMDSYATRGVAR